MVIDASQLRNKVIIPALDAIQMNSEQAIRLLMGTCAQESNMGSYLAQIKGPAFGVYQMEPATYISLVNTYLMRHQDLLKMILGYCGYTETPKPERLIDDLRLSTIMARIRYKIVPIPLPKEDDLEGMGEYWAKYYNCNPVTGNPQHFIQNYKKYCLA